MLGDDLPRTARTDERGVVRFSLPTPVPRNPTGRSESRAAAAESSGQRGHPTRQAGIHHQAFNRENGVPRRRIVRDQGGDVHARREAGGRKARAEGLRADHGCRHRGPTPGPDDRPGDGPGQRRRAHEPRPGGRRALRAPRRGDGPVRSSRLRANRTGDFGGRRPDASAGSRQPPHLADGRDRPT